MQRQESISRTGQASRLPSGWAVVGCSTVGVVALVFAALMPYGLNEEGWRAAIRMTARTSLLLFAPAFAASSLLRLWPAPWSRWLVKNRRHVGVSFAVSHTLHLVFILLLANASAEFVASRTVGATVGGGLAYVLLFAMTATSFDGSAAWIGTRVWKALHKTGMYYIWFLFSLSYFGRAQKDAAFLPPLLLLLAAIGLRLLAVVRARGRRRAA
jgi:hypothetical protein